MPKSSKPSSAPAPAPARITSTDPTRRVEYLALGELSANSRNPKAHDKDLIDASVGRFGFVEPIILDGRTNLIISGHGRTEALRSMEERGETPPEGVEVTAGGSWLVPVVTGWSSRTDTEATAALIALNRSTELGGWVDDDLLELLGELETVDEGLSGVGFDLSDIDDLRLRLEQVADDIDPDEGDGTKESTSMAEYADQYDVKGRRMVVLDYDVDEFPDVVARMRALRAETGRDNNSDAVRILLEGRYPDVFADEAEVTSAAAEAAPDSADEYTDPAATL